MPSALTGRPARFETNRLPSVVSEGSASKELPRAAVPLDGYSAVKAFRNEVLELIFGVFTIEEASPLLELRFAAVDLIR